MTIEYVSGWRDLDAVARKIREVLTRQFAVVPRWQEVPEAEREAALQHASNNLAQVWPSLGEIEEPPCIEHNVQPCHEDDCACGERACALDAWRALAAAAGQDLEDLLNAAASIMPEKLGAGRYANVEELALKLAEDDMETTRAEQMNCAHAVPTLGEVGE